MKDVILQFKNFLYRERKTEDEKIELHRDLEGLPKWGDLTITRAKDSIRTIKLILEIRFEE